MQPMPLESITYMGPEGIHMSIWNKIAHGEAIADILKPKKLAIIQYAGHTID